MQLQARNEAEEILRYLNEISAEDRKDELLLQRYKHKASAATTFLSRGIYEYG